METGQERPQRCKGIPWGRGCDIVDMKCLRNESGEVLVEADAVKERWREYMERLLNIENDWDGVLEGDKIEKPCELINEKEVEEAIKVMKAGKAGGPSEVVGEMLKAAGKKGIKRLTELCNQVVREGAIPREWELSTLISIFKGKGDPMECGSYRAVKLLENGMKVLEGVLEKRLRQKVKIDDMQFGFVPGKGTVDAIFMERFRCRICLTDEEVRCEGERMENLNLENGEVLEGVRKFRYLGDMLNGGRSRLASISRVGYGWKKFRELSGILTSKKMALRLKGKVYGAFV